jgi:hypothetical protein
MSAAAFGDEMRRVHFGALAPDVHFLNHGSFGVSPTSVLAARSDVLQRVERNADLFCRHQVQREFGAVMRQLAPLVHLESPTRSCSWTTPPRACRSRSAPRFATGAASTPPTKLCSSTSPTPTTPVRSLSPSSPPRTPTCATPRVRLGASGCAIELSELEVVEATRAVLASLGDARVVLLVDHITSATGALMPAARIAAMARQLGATVVVDGAHAIGQLDIDLSQLPCDFYVTNLHKWMYTPRGCALLHTAAAFQADTFPLLISHHHLQPYQKRFLMQATRDESRWLSVPAALAFVREIGGFERIWEHQRSFLERSCARLVREWGTRLAFPPERFRAMALVELPRIAVLGEPVTDARAFAFCSLLFRRWKIVVPVPLIDGKLYVRISAQVYCADADIDALARAVGEARAAKTLDDIGFDDTRDWVAYEW